MGIMLGVQFRIHFRSNEILKIYHKDEMEAVVVTKDSENNRIVTLYDFRYIEKGYQHASTTLGHNNTSILQTVEKQTYSTEDILANFNCKVPTEVSPQNISPREYYSGTFPHFVYLADGETETEEDESTFTAMEAWIQKYTPQRYAELIKKEITDEVYTDVCVISCRHDDTDQSEKWGHAEAKSKKENKQVCFDLLPHILHHQPAVKTVDNVSVYTCYFPALIRRFGEVFKSSDSATPFTANLIEPWSVTAEGGYKQYEFTSNNGFIWRSKSDHLPRVVDGVNTTVHEPGTPAGAPYWDNVIATWSETVNPKQGDYSQWANAIWKAKSAHTGSQTTEPGTETGNAVWEKVVLDGLPATFNDGTSDITVNVKTGAGLKEMAALAVKDFAVRTRTRFDLMYAKESEWSTHYSNKKIYTLDPVTGTPQHLIYNANIAPHDSTSTHQVMAAAAHSLANWNEFHIRWKEILNWVKT